MLLYSVTLTHGGEEKSWTSKMDSTILQALYGAL